MKNNNSRNESPLVRRHALFSRVNDLWKLNIINFCSLGKCSKSSVLRRLGNMAGAVIRAFASKQCA